MINIKNKKAGLPPGSVVYVGKKRDKKVKIEIIDYTESKYSSKFAKKVEECFPFKNTPTVTWLNINGIHQTDIIEKIGGKFGIHPLVMEDIANTNQRPKIEDFEDYLFIVLKMLSYNENENMVEIEQVSLVIGPNFVISFQEKEGDVFDSVRERIKGKKGKIRKMGADYLMYSLIDAIVDNYFFVLEKIGEKIEDMEGEVIEKPSPKTMNTIHMLKRSLVYIRKSVWPLRELIGNIQRAESKIIKKTTQIYIRDIYDHTIQVIDTVETFRDMTSSMIDLYLSSVSNRMNEIMKVLTIFAAIFIPLTFVVGVYGMNFENMPELAWKWGYPLIWVVIISVAASMIFYFRRKGWV